MEAGEGSFVRCTESCNFMILQFAPLYIFFCVVLIVQGILNLNYI